MTRLRIGQRLVVLVALLTATVALGAARVAAHPEDCSTHDEETAEHDHSYCISDEEQAGYDDSGANLAPGQLASTRNMHLVANLPKTGPFAPESQFNSDLAFWGKYAFQGNYEGFQITDISAPAKPRVVSQMHCPGSQNDVSVWRNLIFTSTDSRRSDDSCSSFALSSTTTPSSTDPTAEYWEGIKIFDWSNPAAPRLVKAVETDCGSHTHTLVPDGSRVLLYISSYDVNANAKDCRSTGSHFDHDKISIVEVPLANPAAARVISEPVLFPDGGNPGDADTRTTRGCHDITVYQAIGLAAGACMGEGVIMDIRNPAQPKVLSNIIDNENFAFWHSATFSNDGKKVIFTDELGGGGSPTCNPTVGDKKGADAIYDISNPAAPKFLSYFKIPRTQTNTENCVAHNGSLIPVPGRDIMVQAWYQGGISVFDWTDPRNPVEIAFHDRGPSDATRMGPGGSWSVYWYNGLLVSSEIARGLDIFELTPSAHISQNEIDAAKTVRWDHLNAQGQPRIVFPPGFALARAYVDQLERSRGLSTARIAAIRQALQQAEGQQGSARAASLRTLAGSLNGDASGSSDAAKVRMLAGAVEQLAQAR